MNKRLKIAAGSRTYIEVVDGVSEVCKAIALTMAKVDFLTEVV